MLLLIDNFDSFTHNLARYFKELGVVVDVIRNNAITLDEIADINPQYLVISPGPCTPDEAGITLAAISRFAGSIPILGVCLGHQAIGQAFGANVVRASDVLHGKTSPVSHNNAGLFTGLPSPFTATRYHSLVIDPASLSPDFSVDAWHVDSAGNKEIMGIHHNTLPLWGVQFHPESLLTEHGHDMLRNFLTLADAHCRSVRQPT